MKTERIYDDYTVECDEVFSGRIDGNLNVRSGVKFTNVGRVFGDAIVEKDATLENHGRIHGDILGHGFVEVWGVVEGSVLTDHYHIRKDSVVNGKKYDEDEIR